MLALAPSLPTVALTLGTYIGTDDYITSSVRNDFLQKDDNDSFKHACDRLVRLAETNVDYALNTANQLFTKCVVSKVQHLMASLPLHIHANVFDAVDTTLKFTYQNINGLTDSEMEHIQERVYLPPSLRGCGVRSFKLISSAAHLTSSVHTANIVIKMIDGSR